MAASVETKELRDSWQQKNHLEWAELSVPPVEPAYILSQPKIFGLQNQELYLSLAALGWLPNPHKFCCLVAWWL
jgi:hypothetical protein